MVAGGENSVQEELPILCAPFGVTDHFVVHQEIVSVGAARAREPVVVHPQQAHHAVGHRPHRRQGAHGGVPCPEVERAGLVARPVGQQEPGFGQADLRFRRPVIRQRELFLEQALQLSPLPLLVASGRRQEADRRADGLSPPRVGQGGAEEVPDRLDAIHDLGQQPHR